MIKPFNEYIGVTELEEQKNTLIVSECVGLEKVRVYDISSRTQSDLLDWQHEYITEGSILYISLDSTKPTPYISMDGKKIFFIQPERIVAVDPTTTVIPDAPIKSCEQTKVK